MEKKAPKKPLEQLIAEHKEAYRITSKRFRHKRDGTEYQVLMTTHDVVTQELQVIYCLSALTTLKFNREYKKFIENFEEIRS